VLVGVSGDSPDSHRHFRESLALPFRLISDTDRSIMRLYDVRRWFPLLPNKRATYVIDKFGIIRGVYQHELAFGRHTDDVLDGLRGIKDQRRPV
jgi:peroxiredoxin Q/BCP